DSASGSMPDKLSDQRDQYRSLNESFQTSYVHSFGRGFGIGAEIVGVVKSAMICLDRRIRFCLGSLNNPRGFAVRHGWDDYFEPLFPTVELGRLASWNRPQYPYAARISIIKAAATAALRLRTGMHYFMADSLGVSPERLVVRELGVDISYDQACEEFV